MAKQKYPCVCVYKYPQGSVPARPATTIKMNENFKGTWS